VSHLIVVEEIQMEKKRQVCFRIEESVVKEMEKIREKTGVPVSTQIEMRIKGYSIIETQPPSKKKT